MKLLIKYPTRGRPLWFVKTLDMYMRMLSGKHEVEFLVAMDTDDETMRNDLMMDYLAQIEPPKDSMTTLSYYYAEHRGKVEAVNSCISSKEFDIVLAVSDDVEPQQMAYDDTICACMLEAFPDLDGVIYFDDGRAKPGRVTIPIMGKPFYMEMGTFIHPDFIAWGDDYMSKKWRQTGRLQFFDEVLLRHCYAKYIHMDPTAKRAARFRVADARTTARLNNSLQKQIRTTVETIDFAEMTGEKPPQTCQEFMAQHDFTYRRLDNVETAQIAKNIKRDLERDSYIRAGIGRQQDWEKGWQENLVVYRQTRDIEDLIPRYYRKTEILRYQGKYIKPADAEFQLNIMRAILLWLGESHITHVLYEFGCGSGYNLAYLNKHFPSKRYCGLDWAKSSQAIMNELGFLGGEFDLMSPDHSLQLEPNSTVLTFGALEQIGREHTAFIDYLLTQPIAKAIHIEPIIELYCLGSKADRLAKIYAEKRGYLQGFLTALRNHKGIRIRECRKLIGDRNQDCWSLIIWEKESNGS